MTAVHLDFHWQMLVKRLSVVLYAISAVVPVCPGEAAASQERQSAECLLTTADGTAPGSIDAIRTTWMALEGLPARELIADRALVRRLHLDVIGRLPSPSEVDTFEADTASDKVERLVDRLLDDRQGYAEHWITWWADLLRNDEQTSIDGLRKPITRWLYGALRDNTPYDHMVTELLAPGEAGPDGYLLGVNWRGRVNLSQRPPVQAAQNVAQVFLATSIRCASCHDGFTTHWQLEDAYGLASFFADEPLEMARCEKGTGKIVPPRFLFPELGSVPADADLATRREAVARMVTSRENPRFARVLVNRLWDRLLGTALIEPLDEMEPEDAPCPELLDWLAEDFVAHRYDLKHTIRLILTSRAYRETILEGTRAPDGPADLGPSPRRLTAEQFLDGLSSLTGYWPSPDKLVDVAVPGGEVRAWRHKVPSALAIALGRPNREQVVTRRNQDATVLQALEATNGRALASLIESGTATLLESSWGRLDQDAALDELVQRAYGRRSSVEERALLRPLLGEPHAPIEERKPGIEDVLWMIVNSPEFQSAS